MTIHTQPAAIDSVKKSLVALLRWKYWTPHCGESNRVRSPGLRRSISC